MRLFNKITILFTTLYLAAGCSKDFLNENLTPGSFPMGLSNIYVSPDWPSSNYTFMLPSVKNADYEIISRPSWLNISSVKGQLSDSIAIVQCSATKNSDFDAVGIYMDFMTVEADGKDYKVPAAYITEGNPMVQVQSSLALSYYDNPILPIQNNGLGILIWGIVSMPEWLVVDTAWIESNGFYVSPFSSYSIPFRFNFDNSNTGSLTGKIVLSTNDKMHPSVTIDVTVNMGTPLLEIYTNTIDFSFTETSKTLNLLNGGDGILVWEFENIPEWLTITPSSGVCGEFPHYSIITFCCDRTKLSPGQNTATVNLKTNDSSNPESNITVMAKAPQNMENIYSVDGNITDALLNNNTNILYYVTSSPNKLVSYDIVERKVLNEISLSKAPTSFAASEDWTKAAVGHNGYISAIDLSSNTVTTIYPLDCSVYDIAWAENDWFCYTQSDGYFTCLHWINIADGTLYNSHDNNSLDGATTIKKVPDQPYLIATRNYTSPSGFFTYDIATKNIKSYAHMDLSNFWFSENGDYIFAKDKSIYRTTSATNPTDTLYITINPIGTIITGVENYYGLQYVYHSNNYLWVLQNNSHPSDNVPTSIYQIEDNDYTLVNGYEYDIIYQPDTQTAPLNISANYIFTNNEGTEILVLCKDTSSSSWVIQFVNVK